MPKFNAKYVRLALNALNLCKIYAIRSMLKFNAKNVRLALNALSLCKIYAKINAKYVRSTLKFNANM